MPTAAEGTPGRCSVRIRSPLERTVLRPVASSRAERSTSRRLTGGAASLRGGRRGLGRLAVACGRLDDRLQADLAAVVDLGDLDLDLLPDADDVLGVVDPLAAGEVLHLADVQQAVLAGGQRDERAGGGRLPDGAEVARAALGHRREGDRLDGAAGRLGTRTVGGA